MDGGIFLSYRRDDSAGYAGRLYDRLKERFPGRVFMDVGEIGVGEDFVAAIESRLASCRVLVVLIGPAWNPARLSQDGDFVHLEILHGIRARLKVMPVLLHGARVPAAGELPADLAGLTRLQALRISDEGWDRDVEALIDAIGKAIGRGAKRRTNFGAAALAGFAAALILAMGVWWWWQHRSNSTDAALLVSAKTTDAEKRYVGSIANDYNKAADVLDSIGKQIDGSAATQGQPVSARDDWGPGERKDLALDVPGDPHSLTINISDAVPVVVFGVAAGGTCPLKFPTPPTKANYEQRQCGPAPFNSTAIEALRITQNRSGKGVHVTIRMANAEKAPRRTIVLSGTY